MTRNYLEAVCREGQTVNPLFTFLDARLTHVDAREAIIVIPVTERLRQGGGMVAGGILATLADEAMAHVVLAFLGDKAAVTAEMNIRYLRGARPGQGGSLTARATLIRGGQSLCVANATVHDSQERLLAVAGATFYVQRSA